MCGRFALDSSMNELIEEFVADGGDYRHWEPGYNIAPTDPVPVILERHRDGATTRSIEPGRWSLVPSWSKELKLKFPTFNARSEGIAEKASFKSSVANKRALIPASGYYEWHTVGSTKTPNFIRPVEGIVAFAGLYSWWRESPAAEWQLTATILTMPTVPHLAEIHDRNPVMLPRDWWDDWLDPTLTGDQFFVDAAVAASVSVADSLEFHEVGPVRGNERALIQPI
ncbi:SOS response-associated peptidase [Glaciihabitans arcticus]|uniref:Abasic site processing protein n=1 Tax=Glaciihabitans arcticus TaxID=2668039 RepID=A0A4Q9GSJ7_9MICO|nr:SOS response-associated peptidase [Glaciihabitans arcticus]TBN57982.1 SOS response-associated peptidase [Glaciihabitans arcticus]